MNNWSITGRICSDPEAAVTSKQTLITTIRVAIKKQFKNKETGQYESDFFTLKAFNKTADFLKMYFSKGDMIEAEVNIFNNNYTKENGDRVWQDVYVINKITKLVSGKKEGF